MFHSYPLMSKTALFGIVSVPLVVPPNCFFADCWGSKASNLHLGVNAESLVWRCIFIQTSQGLVQATMDLIRCLVLYPLHDCRGWECVGLGSAGGQPFGRVVGGLCGVSMGGLCGVSSLATL